MPMNCTSDVTSSTPVNGTITNPIIAGSMMRPGARVKSALSTPEGV